MWTDRTRGVASPASSHLHPALFRAVAERREIGDQAGEPEDRRNCGIGRDREHVPHQRAAELRPYPHRVWVGEEPVREPGASDVDRGENSSGGHGEQRHGFGETVDRIAPLLTEQKQDGGDERPGMTDADPPDEVDNGEAPSDRDGHAPDADSFEEEVSDGEQHHHGEHEADAESDEPAVRGGAGQHDGADLFGDRAERVAWLDNRSSLEVGRRFVLLWHEAASCF